MVTLRQAATLSLSLSEERLRLAHTSSEGHFRQALAHYRRHGVMGSALSIVCVVDCSLFPPACQPAETLVVVLRDTAAYALLTQQLGRAGVEGV